MRESARASVVGARAWWVRARKRAKTHLFTHLALDTPRTRHTMETFPCGGRLGGSDQHSERDVVRIRRDGLPREQPFALTLLREFTCLPPMRRKRTYSIFLYTRTHSICLCKSANVHAWRQCAGHGNSLGITTLFHSELRRTDRSLISTVIGSLGFENSLET